MACARSRAREAAATVARLEARGIAGAAAARSTGWRAVPHSRSVRGRRGSRRLRRHAPTTGILHLLLGHHAADQAETLLIRALGGSGPAGMAGMAPLVETTRLRLLRPLLAVPPGRLRATLSAAGVAWVEDPSNADRAALRPRLRLLRRDRDGDGSATAALVAAAAASGRSRAGHDRNGAANLAAQVSLRPEGFALLSGQAARPTCAGGAAAGNCRSAVSAGHQIACRPCRGTPASDAWPGSGCCRRAGLAPDCLPFAKRPRWRRRCPRSPVPSGTGGSVSATPRLVPPDATLGALGDDCRPAAPVFIAAGCRAADPAGDQARRNASRGAASASILTARDANAIPMLFSPPRPAAAAPFRSSGMHEGSRHPMLM